MGDRPISLCNSDDNTIKEAHLVTDTGWETLRINRPEYTKRNKKEFERKLKTDLHPSVRLPKVEESVLAHTQSYEIDIGIQQDLTCMKFCWILFS